MKKLLLIGLLYIMAVAQASAVTYYNVGTEPNDVASWNTIRGGGGSSPSNFTSAGDIFTVQTDMESTSMWTVSGIGAKLSIEDNVNFISNNFNHIISLEILGSGNYYLEGNHSNLVFLTLSSDAKITIGGSSAPVLRTNVSYPNLVISTSRALPINLNSNLTVSNNLVFDLASTSKTFNFIGTAGISNYTVSVGGDLIVQGSSVVQLNLNSNASPLRNLTLSIGGNLSLTAGTLNGTLGTGNALITCNNFDMTGGIFNAITGGATATGFPTFTLLGDLNLSLGTYRARNGVLITSTPVYNLDGSGKQIFGTSITNAVHTINLTGSYTLNTNFTVGGSMIFNTGYVLNLGSNAAILNGALVVNGIGTFNGGSGTVTIGPAGIGASIPGITVGTLNINRSGQTISLVGSPTINTNLNLNAGILSIGANLLTITGTITPGSGSLVGGSTSSLDFTTSASGQVIPSATYNNLTFSNTANNSIAVGVGGITVNGTLTLTRDELNNSTNGLTLGNGATVVINKTGTNNTGALNSAPTFGAAVNLSYTGNNAVITGPEVPSSSTVLNNFTCSNTGGITLGNTTTINGALTLATAGTLNTAGFLTLNLNSGYIPHGTVGSVSGNIICTKTISRANHTYIGSPVTGTINFPATAQFDSYIETAHDRNGNDDAGWVTASTSQILLDLNQTAMKGFAAYYGAGTTALSVTGAYAHNTDKSITVTRTVVDGDSDDGWNLIANPFPSTFDWEAESATFPSNVAKEIQYWNGTAYEAYTAGVPAGDALGKLAPFQGFFMHVTSGSSASLTFRSANRVSSTKSLKREGKSEVANVLQITATSGSLVDKSYIRLQKDATAKFDNNYDATKLDNDPSMSMVWTESLGVKYAINAFPLNNKDSVGLVPLKIKAPESARYTFNFSENARIEDNIQIFLIDKLLNKKQDIRLNPIYNANIVKEDTAARFFISFSGQITSFEEAQDVFSASIENNNVNTYFKNINAKVARIDLLNSMGQTLYSNEKADITTNKFSFTPNISNQAGVYILKATVGNKVYTQKILLN